MIESLLNSVAVPSNKPNNSSLSPPTEIFLIYCANWDTWIGSVFPVFLRSESAILRLGTQRGGRRGGA